MNEEKVIIEYQDKLQEKEVKKFKEATSNYYVLGYIDKLEQENKQLKGSLQTYEILLKVNIEENQNLKEQLQQKEDIINKAKELIHKHIREIEKLKLRIYPKEYYELLEILDNKGE